MTAISTPKLKEAIRLQKQGKTMDEISTITGVPVDVLSEHLTPAADPFAALDAPAPKAQLRDTTRAAVTVFSSDSGLMTKTLSVVDGKLKKVNGGDMAKGLAVVRYIDTPAELVDLIVGLDSNQAIGMGLAANEREVIGTKAGGGFARTKENFAFNQGPGWMTLDLDTRPGVGAMGRQVFYERYLTGAPCVWNPSSSSFVDGFTELGGQHWFIRVQDASDIPRAGKMMYERSWLDGHGWWLVSKSGALLDRSLIDGSVFKTNHLSFDAAPVCVGVTTKRPAPQVFGGDLPAADTRLLFPDLTADERARVAEIKARTRAAMSGEAEVAREAFLLWRSEGDPVKYHELANMLDAGGLPGDYMLRTEAGVTVSVDDVLRNLEKYDGTRFADPIDPEGYGGDSRIAWLKGTVLFSHAHGGGKYQLHSSRVAGDVAQKLAAKILAALQLNGGLDCSVSATVIDDYINGSFWSGTSGKLSLLSKAGTLNVFTGAEAAGGLSRRYGACFQATAPESMKEKEKVAFYALPMRMVLNHIKDANQRSRVSWRVDMFATEDSIVIGANKVVVTLKYRPPVLCLADANAVVVADYKAHFPEIDQLIDHIAAARFAASRKKAYTWLLADSNWGKGLLMSAIIMLGLGVELSVKEIEAALEGGAIGRDHTDFVHAWVLFINEFKNVKAELKQIENEITFAPKFGFSETVPVFSKFFLSAEGVSSLTGAQGVEDQFANRMSLLVKKGSIETRPVFMEVGEGAYCRALAVYVGKRIAQRVAEYVPMGKEAAERLAGERLSAFHVEFGIRNEYATISDRLPEIAAEFLAWLESPRANCADLHYTVECQATKVKYLTRPGKIIGQFIFDVYGNGAEAQTLTRRKDDLIEAIAEPCEGKRSSLFKVNGTVVRGVRLRAVTK